MTNLSQNRKQMARITQSLRVFSPGTPHQILHSAASEHHVPSRRRASSVHHKKRKIFGGDGIGTPAVDVDAFRSTFDSCYLWEITIEFVIVTSSLSFLLSFFSLTTPVFRNVWICNFMLKTNWMHNGWNFRCTNPFIPKKNNRGLYQTFLENGTILICNFLDQLYRACI